MHPAAGFVIAVKRSEGSGGKKEEERKRTQLVFLAMLSGQFDWGSLLPKSNGGGNGPMRC
jgi:hypothetical protein